MKVDFTSPKSFKPTLMELERINANEYDELQKLATVYKGENWRLALTCLFKAKELLFTKGTAPVLQQVTRFPIFLQQAGYFDEAKFELQELLNNADYYAQNDVKGIRKNKKLFKQYFKTLYLEHLFDKASLIYKRQKLLQESDELHQISLGYSKERAELRQKIDDIKEKELMAFEKECEELSKQYPDLASIDEVIKKAEKQNASQNKAKENSFLEAIVGFVVFILIAYGIYKLF